MDSSPFLFAPPPLDAPPLSAPGYLERAPAVTLALDGYTTSSSGPSTSLASLALPLWPATSHGIAMDLRPSEWLSTRPFTAPASAFTHALYAQQEGLVTTMSHSPHAPVETATPLYAPSAFSPTLLGANATTASPSDGWYRQETRTRDEQEKAMRLRQVSEPGQQSVYVPQQMASMSIYHQTVPAMAYQPSVAPGSVLHGGLSQIATTSANPKTLLRPWAEKKRAVSEQRPRTGSSTSSLQRDMRDSDEEPKAIKKRPRRKFEEIERLYKCSHGGCDKAYGTLNHLNAHVHMQKHGAKRLPQEFKEVRAAWKARKKADEANKTARGKKAAVEAETIVNEERESSASPAADPTAADLLHGGSYAHDYSAPSPLSGEEDEQFAYQPQVQHVPLLSRVQRHLAPPTLIRPQTAPLAVVTPQPLRPQTAPSVPFLGDRHNSNSPGGEAVLLSAASSSSSVPVPMMMQPDVVTFRRASVPDTHHLPTVHESMTDFAYSESMGVF